MRLNLHEVRCALIAILCTTAPVSSFAQTAKYDDTYTLQGFSQPGRLAEVASATQGIVQSHCVRAGDHVKAGDCLVLLDSAVHETRVELARVGKDSRGELKAAKSEFAAKQTRLKRLQELAQRDHATPVELLQATEDVTIAEANVLRAEDRLAQQNAEYQRLLAESKEFQIVAPFDGVIVEFTKEPGEYVGAADPAVCTLADLATLSVDFLVPRNYRHNLNVGDEVAVVFTVEGKRVDATVEYVSPFPNGETNTFTVKTIVDNRDGRLTAGEKCQINGVNRDVDKPVNAMQVNDNRTHHRRSMVLRGLK